MLKQDSFIIPILVYYYSESHSANKKGMCKGIEGPGATQIDKPRGVSMLLRKMVICRDWRDMWDPMGGG